MSEDFGVLKNIFEEFCREIKTIDNETDRNRRCIREAETYIKGLTDAETDDFKVFSPRKAEIIHKEELEEAREKIIACEEKNQKLNQKRELLAGYTEKLEDILRRLENESAVRAREVRDLRDESIQKLDDLAKRIDLVGSCIEKKPVQAKQDLAIIVKRLKEVTDGIRGTVWLIKEEKDVNVKGDQYAGFETKKSGQSKDGTADKKGDGDSGSGSERHE